MEATELEEGEIQGAESDSMTMEGPVSLADIMRELRGMSGTMRQMKQTMDELRAENFDLRKENDNLNREMAAVKSRDEELRRDGRLPSKQTM